MTLLENQNKFKSVPGPGWLLSLFAEQYRSDIANGVRAMAPLWKLLSPENFGSTWNGFLNEFLLPQLEGSDLVTEIALLLWPSMLAMWIAEEMIF
jgi:hypothetical protein